MRKISEPYLPKSIFLLHHLLQIFLKRSHWRCFPALQTENFFTSGKVSALELSRENQKTLRGPKRLCEIVKKSQRVSFLTFICLMDQSYERQIIHGIFYKSY